MLNEYGYDTVVRPSKIDEIVDESLSMEEMVISLAHQKASAVIADLISNEPDLLNKYDYLIAADTIVYKDQLMGKPLNKEDGFQMLSKLRNTGHFVATGVSIYNLSTKTWDNFCDVTEVFFKDYSHEELLDYLDTDEAYDKAGGYGIQGTFAKYVDHYTGSYNNVVGFPIEKIIERI
jgi:septum formation protein